MRFTVPHLYMHSIVYKPRRKINLSFHQFSYNFQDTLIRSILTHHSSELHQAGLGCYSSPKKPEVPALYDLRGKGEGDFLYHLKMIMGIEWVKRISMSSSFKKDDCITMKETKKPEVPTLYDLARLLTSYPHPSLLPCLSDLETLKFAPSWGLCNYGCFVCDSLISWLTPVGPSGFSSYITS